MMREASNGKYEPTAFSIDSYEDEGHDGTTGVGDGAAHDDDVDVDDLFMEEGNEEEGAAYSSGGNNGGGEFGGYHGGSGGERTLELRQLRRRSLRTKAVVLLCLAVSLGVLVVGRSYWEDRISAQSSQASPDGDVNSAQQYANAAAGTSEPPPGWEEEKEEEAAEKEAEAEEEEEEEEEAEEEEEEEKEEEEKAIKGVGDTEDQHDKISHESVDDETDTKAEEALEPDVGLDLDFDSEGVACVGDRLNNGVQLKSGEFLCAHEKNFKFGMTPEGNLIWRNEAGAETRTYYRGAPGSYFVLQPDGAMTVYGKRNKIKWNKECKATIHLSRECLPTKKNIYDCPYLHLHGGEKGALVLNWIADDGNWESHNFKNWYELGN